MNDRPKSFFETATEMQRKSNPPEMLEKLYEKEPSLPSLLKGKDIDLKRPK
jgi:hypothetical protein